MNIKDLQFGLFPTKQNIRLFREDLNGYYGNFGRFCAFFTVIVNVLAYSCLALWIAHFLIVKGII
jgi:hypothetical protein